ncbi:inhibitor of growth protein 1 homolog [Culex quinquefasciatus]|uniref:inhibitor of growth protein 1 homolog n=1 Tax=Culex quinquefasciatus TaxID=7176 RepID=UPI0018E37C4D|nr:inhibitor of growth protein 1 homolog [Culex quinquefasciatus]
MINQVTVEALHSANYVENYLDSVENLPDDVQRHLSRIREIDVLYRNHLRDVSIYYEQWNGANGTGAVVNGGGGGAGSDSSSTDQLSQATKRAIVRMQQGLIAAQELGDEKLQIVQHLQDLIDHKTRTLDQDFKNLGSDFFSRLDYGREEKMSVEQQQQQQKEIRTASPACSPNNNSASNVSAIASPSAAFAASSSTGNGPSGVGSGGNGGGDSSSVGGASGGYSSGGGNANGNNGGGSGGNGSGAAGSGVGGGSASSGNGNGGTERGSKRARRTRNEQTGGSANNGSSTPNSTSGAMEVDPIDTSNIKQEDVVGQAASGGNGGGGTPGSGGAGAGKATSSGSGSAAGGNGGGAGGSGSGAAGSSGQSTGGGAGGQGKRAQRRPVAKEEAKDRRAGTGPEAREDTPPPEETIDPDEPTYCLCDQISFGEMILCDNDLCPIEWFHFSCVALMSKPKGKWFCPNCRGDRPNVMKPKAQFLKELERYNKEKEEKT